MISGVIDDFVGTDPVSLDAAVRELELERRCVEAKLAAAIAVIEQRQQFRDDGHRSINAYLRATLNCGSGEASRLARRARMINSVPQVGDAHLAGHVGTAQVDRLGRSAAHRRVGHRFAEFAPQLLRHAEHLEFADFEVVVQRFELLADPDGGFDDQKFQEDERTATVTTVGSGVHVAAHGGSALQAAEMKAIFEQAVQDEFVADCEARRREFGDDAQLHPLPRTVRQRSFDALYAIFMAHVTVPADGQRPEPIVNIVIDHVSAGQALFDHGLVDTPDVFGPASTGPDLAKRRCETADGTPLHPDVALAAMLTGHVRRVVVDGAGVITDLGRRRRLFTGSAREAAKLLVRTCVHRGCIVPGTFCDVDHLTEWAADHGATDQHNAGALCGIHDRHKHRQRLRARRTVDGTIRLIRSDGTLIGPAGEREPDWADEDRHQPTTRSPDDDRPPDTTQAPDGDTASTASMARQGDTAFSWPVHRFSIGGLRQCGADEVRAALAAGRH